MVLPFLYVFRPFKTALIGIYKLRIATADEVVDDVRVAVHDCGVNALFYTLTRNRIFMDQF